MLRASRKGPEEQDTPAKDLKVEVTSLLPAKGLVSAGESLLPNLLPAKKIGSAMPVRFKKRGLTSMNAM